MFDPTELEVVIQARLARLHFEQVAGYLLCTITLVIIPLGMYSDQLALRVATLAPAIGIMSGVLATVLGGAWFRGHMDTKLTMQSLQTSQIITQMSKMPEMPEGPESTIGQRREPERG